MPFLHTFLPYTWRPPLGGYAATFPHRWGKARSGAIASRKLRLLSSGFFTTFRMTEWFSRHPERAAPVILSVAEGSRAYARQTRPYSRVILSRKRPTLLCKVGRLRVERSPVNSALLGGPVRLRAQAHSAQGDTREERADIAASCKTSRGVFTWACLLGMTEIKKNTVLLNKDIFSDIQSINRQMFKKFVI